MPSTTNTLITLREPAPTHPAPKMTFGRGGAGNRTSTTRRPPPPSHLPPTTDTHSLHSSTHSNTAHYSTGRGGAGNMHDAVEERRMFSFDEELAKEGKVGAVPVYHIGRGGQGNTVDEARRRPSGSSFASEAPGARASLEWIRGLGKRS